MAGCGKEYEKDGIPYVDCGRWFKGKQYLCDECDALLGDRE